LIDVEACLIEDIALKIEIFMFHELINCQETFQTEFLAGIKRTQARLSFRLRRMGGV